MNNFFIAQAFDWQPQTRGRLPRLIEWVARRFRLKWQIRRAMDPMRDMTSITQRCNLWHLASQVVHYEVPGDFAEFGCFDGKTAALFQKVIDEQRAARSLHLYDHFKIAFTQTGRDIRAELLRNFRAAGASEPTIHEGDFAETVPAQLPARLAFVHIDCGFGGDSQLHANTVFELLTHIYPRMSPGGVVVLMDYHEEGTSEGINYNPGVARAAKRFLADKHEEMVLLWADEYTHGYFRKR